MIYFTGEKHAANKKSDYVQPVPARQREMMIDLLHGISKIGK